MITGSLFIFVAGLGIIRFKDLFSRLHATSKATSFGLMLIIIGTALFFSHWLVWLKALLVITFVYLTSPLSSHSIAKSYKDSTGSQV